MTNLEPKTKVLMNEHLIPLFTTFNIHQIRCFNCCLTLVDQEHLLDPDTYYKVDIELFKSLYPKQSPSKTYKLLAKLIEDFVHTPRVITNIWGIEEPEAKILTEAYIGSDIELIEVCWSTTLIPLISRDSTNEE